ncbi:5148_t:CDS:1, partial [Dentiscutata heterogama]
QTTVANTFTNNIYILDIRNYTWITSVNLNVPPTTTSAIPTPTANQPTIIQQSNNNLYIGIGIGVCGIILIGILFTAGFLIYKKLYKKPIETSGSIINESIRESHSSVVYV